MLTLVFDLDGTLVDTAPDLIDTLNFTLVRHDLPAVRFDAARPLIGGGARGMIERALAAEGRDCSPAGVDELYAAFVPHYAPHTSPLSIGLPRPVTGSRYAPTSSNGSPGVCWKSSGLAAVSPRYAVRTLSAFRSPTRRCSARPSCALAETQ